MSGTMQQRPDQGYSPPVSPVSPTQAAGILRAKIVIITGGGLFVYRPGTTPALGNPPIASITNNSTDPFGNAVIPGGFNAMGTPAAGAAVLESNELNFYTSATDAGPFTEALSMAYQGGALSFTGEAAEDLLSLTYQVGGLTALVWMFPSGDNTGAIDTAALAGYILTFLGGTTPITVLMAPGTYWIKAGQLTVSQPGFRVYALGQVDIVGIGTGDLWRQFKASNYVVGDPVGSGIYGNPTFDMSGMGNGSAAIHAGDMYQMHFDATVRFAATAGATAKNFWFDNQNTVNGAEQITGEIFSEEGAIVFDNSSNVPGNVTGSFDRCALKMHVDNKGKSNILVLQNGAEIIAPDQMLLTGNTDYGASLFSVITITGTNTTNGFSRIVGGQFSVDVECNGTSGTQPKTIAFGTAGSNVLTGCSGSMKFDGNNAFANATNFLSSFQYDGPVYGDADLQRCLGLGTQFFQHGALSTGQTIQTKYMTTNKVTTTTDVTGIILQGFQPDDGRLFLVENKGTGKITFAVAGTSHVAGGTSVVIQPSSSMLFQWDNNDSLWYQIGTSITGPWNVVGAAGQPAFALGWSNFGHGGADLSFRLIGDNVEINGVIQAAVAAAATVFTLPAALNPADIQFIPGFDLTAPGPVVWSVSAAGVVALASPAVASGDEYTINGTISLSV